jgi:hypothetical protein
MKELKKKLNDLAILSSEKRFNILLALYASEVLENKEDKNDIRRRQRKA